MTIEKEAARIAVEASGALSGVWHWIAGTIGAGIAALWMHVTGRVQKLEERIVGKDSFDEHKREEKESFNVLFRKVDSIQEDVSDMGASIARIEGHLDAKRNGDK